MAPQQNSTLIDEKLGDCPSLLNIPEEINRYSPILPPKNKENHDKCNNNNNKININNTNNYYQHHDVNSFPKWDLARKDQRDLQQNKHYRNGDNRSSHSRRSRSISLYGVNSTVKQGHKEITIWLNDEPRYVSGVTNKTTCNDIIKALIDDEISNGNYEYCQRLKDGSASRDYSDYVITECWRGIERSYDGNMAILPVWKAWSRVHNEIRLSLKHHKDIQDPTKALKINITLSSIRYYICKLLRLGTSKTRNTKSKKSSQTIKSKPGEKKTQPDHVALLLKPESKSSQEETYSKKMENNVGSGNMKLSNEDEEINSKTKINNQRLFKLVETRSSVRKRRSSSRRKNKKSCHNGKHHSINNGDGNNFLRKRKDSCLRSSIRKKLAKKNAEMNELYDREYALTRELTNKCKMYKLHNELYTTCDKNLEMSVGQIQQSIEACAKEIIHTEHKLLEVKNEIKHDISVINSLKRLTLDSDSKENVVPNNTKNPLRSQADVRPTATATTKTATNFEHMLFVDNIYEFCDNNASMLV